MKKNFIFNLFFLAATLLFIDGPINNYCFKRKKEYPLKTETDPVKALAIFNDNGFSGFLLDLVYETINDKVSIMYGHGVCQKVLEILYPKEKLTNVLAWAIYLPATIYHYGNQREGPNQIIRGVNCRFGNNRNYFFISNAARNYYYVFAPKLSGEGEEIKACLKILPKEIKYPKIKIMETRNELLADSIFATFGTIRKNDKRHVCKKVDKDLDVIRGEGICQKVLMQQGLKLQTTFTLISVSCEDQKITRFISEEFEPTKTEPVKYIQGPTVKGAKCLYKKSISEENFEYFMMVINTPTDGYYYISEQIEKNVWSVNAVIKVF